MSNLKGKFTNNEILYLSQFNDNQHCVRAVQMALSNLDKDDDANLKMLRRLVYVTSIAAQSTDDDVFVCGMLHPLAEFKNNEDLAVLMTGLGYEALKVVQALKETEDVSQLYDRVSSIDPKYKAIVMARVMYRLLNIQLFDYADAESIIDEANTYTKKLDAPYDIRVQFDIILSSAESIFNELYATEIIEDTDSDDIVSGKEMTTDDWIEFKSHNMLAKELDVTNKQVITLPDFGKVTYYEGIGFCDDNGELIKLNQETPEKKTNIINTKKVNMLKDDFDEECMIHLSVAKSLGVIMDNQVTNLGDFGKVIFSQGIGFFNENAEMISLKGSIFEDIIKKYDTQENTEGSEQEIGKPVEADTTDDDDFSEAVIDLSGAERAITQAKHHRYAVQLKIQDGEIISIAGVGKVTYNETIGFIDELGNLVDLEAALVK